MRPSDVPSRFYIKVASNGAIKEAKHQFTQLFRLTELDVMGSICYFKQLRLATFEMLVVPDNSISAFSSQYIPVSESSSDWKVASWVS